MDSDRRRELLDGDLERMVRDEVCRQIQEMCRRELAAIEQRILYGTRKREPLGILHAQDTVKP